MTNYRKLATDRLLKFLDSQNISAEEREEVRSIIEDRERRKAKAIAAIELADVGQILRRLIS